MIEQLGAFLKKARPLPKNWHSDFRNPKKLPNLQLEFGLRFLRNLSFGLLAFLALLVAAKQYHLKSIAKDMEGIQLSIEEQNKVNRRQLIVSSQFKEKSKIVSSIAKIFLPNPDWSRFLIELANMQTKTVQFYEFSMKRSFDFPEEQAKVSPRNLRGRNKLKVVKKEPFLSFTLEGQIYDEYDFALSAIDELKGKIRQSEVLKGFSISALEIADLRRKELPDKSELLAFVLKVEVEKR